MSDAGTEVAESGWFIKLIKLIVVVWSTLPNKSKERIIESIVDGFDAVFRHFFKRATASAAEVAAK